MDQKRADTLKKINLDYKGNDAINISAAYMISCIEELERDLALAQEDNDEGGKMADRMTPEQVEIIKEHLNDRELDRDTSKLDRVVLAYIELVSALALAQAKVERLRKLVQAVLNCGGTPDLFYPDGYKEGWDEWMDEARAVMEGKP